MRRSILRCTLALWLIFASLPAWAEAPIAPQPGGPQLPAGTRVVKNAPYVKNGHPNQTLDLYLPAQPKGPLLVWIHGGGWQAGNKNQVPGLGMLAEGYAVASLEYRFTQHAIFPAQIEDCKAALRWLRAYAKDYGYDPNRVAAWGASAGGHLVAMLAVTGETRDFDVGEYLDQSSAISCGIDWFGPADFPAFNGSEMVRRDDPNSPITKLLGGLLADKLELAAKASPVTYVSAKSAPLLIMHGTKDALVPLDQSQRLADAYEGAGAEVKLDVIEGAGHGGDVFMNAQRIQMMKEFVTRHLTP